MQKPKRDEVIRFRAETELKQRLGAVATANRKKPAEFLREKIWELVEAQETALASRNSRRRRVA